TAINRLRNIQLRVLTTFDQTEHELDRADFQGGCPFAHVPVAENDVKSAIATGIDVRFVAGVDERTPIHGVDADDHAEEIGALRDLKKSRLTRTAFAFYAHFAGARKNLARNQKRQNRRNDAIPRHIALHEVIVVTAVAVPEEIRVVFVEANFLAARQL